MSAVCSLRSPVSGLPSPVLTSVRMTLVADLELPQFEYLDPELRGERFHETLRELRERSWVARSEFGYFVLDRESAGMFLRARSAEFPA